METSGNNQPSRVLSTDTSLGSTVGADFAGILGMSALWAEPSPDLGSHVVARISSEILVVSEQLLRTTPHSHPEFDAEAQSVRFGIRSRTSKMFATAAGLAIVVGSTSFLLFRQTAEPSFSFVLAATSLLPDAVGKVKITPIRSGLKIELRATGLPRRDGSKFYEAWLKGPKGLVPVGTFHSGENVVLWAGVAFQDFPTLTITEEEVGDQNSSGKKVLFGTTIPETQE